jgi:fatty-acyl-CoA synthase
VIKHSDARVLIYDHELEAVARDIARQVGGGLKLVRAGGSDEYEQLLAEAVPHAAPVADERAMLSINYTSGTTGAPKGVMYHHRGAYLQALAMASHMRLDCDSVYLWTLPMFHCNGWCFPWGVTAAGATHLCLRKLDPELIWRHLRETGVTHFCAAPTVLIMVAWSDARPRQARANRACGNGRRAADAGAADAHGGAGHRRHSPLTALPRPSGRRSSANGARNGAGGPCPSRRRSRHARVSATLFRNRCASSMRKARDVPADGRTLGEIALRGNNVMLGYYLDDDATRRAAPDGWFRTGDLGVMHADRYVEIKDRAKDIIISGGENIASLEIERALSAHPAVLEAASGGGPDAKWGEVPVAFVALKPGATTSEALLIAHARSALAHFKAPKKIVFGELPKNAHRQDPEVRAARARQRNHEKLGSAPPSLLSLSLLSSGFQWTLRCRLKSRITACATGRSCRAFSAAGSGSAILRRARKHTARPARADASQGQGRRPVGAADARERRRRGLNMAGIAPCYEEMNYSIFGPVVFNCARAGRRQHALAQPESRPSAKGALDAAYRRGQGALVDRDDRARAGRRFRSHDDADHRHARTATSG